MASVLLLKQSETSDKWGGAASAAVVCVHGLGGGGGWCSSCSSFHPGSLVLWGTFCHLKETLTDLKAEIGWRLWGHHCTVLGVAFDSHSSVWMGMYSMYTMRESVHRFGKRHCELNALIKACRNLHKGPRGERQSWWLGLEREKKIERTIHLFSPSTSVVLSYPPIPPALHADYLLNKTMLTTDSEMMPKRIHTFAKKNLQAERFSHMATLNTHTAPTVLRQ